MNRLKRRSPRLQTLECRQLLAADVPVQMGPSQIGMADLGAAEGNDAVASWPDLVQFADDLTQAGVKLYGAAWASPVTEQMQLFGDGANELPFIEVTNPDRSASQIAVDLNVTSYPTWEFPDETRATGLLDLSEIASRSGVPIPFNTDTTFEPIGDQTVNFGSPLHLPIDAYDPAGRPIRVTVSVEDPALLEAVVLTGNRSARFDMRGYGDMVFELFEQRAPEATSRFIELAEVGFYHDILIHRVIDDFVIQGGDPMGTGVGSSRLPDFDDDFHPDLQHNRPGVLSFAKSSDDTNNSQFFVTEVPTRFLDFQHSVFGQLVEGEDVRDAISEHAVNGADRPTTDVVIDTVEVFNDSENSVIMLKPTGNAAGTTNVTVMVQAEGGILQQETFQVAVGDDTANSQPFLAPIEVASSYANTRPAEIAISSIDIEGDAVTYSAQVMTPRSGVNVSVDQTGELQVTPQPGFVGSADIQVTVRPGPGVTGNGSSDSDNQVITVNFATPEPTPPPAIITPNIIEGPHVIAASRSQTALIFRATANATISVLPIGTTSVKETVLVLDENTNSIGQFVSGTTTASVVEGELYAIVFEPSSADRLFVVRSSSGAETFATTRLSNLFQPTDANADGRTTLRDALAVINALQQGSPSEGESSAPTVFADTNRDGRISVLDALKVINQIARGSAGEGELAGNVSDILDRSNSTNRVEVESSAPEEMISEPLTEAGRTGPMVSPIWYGPQQDGYSNDQAIREMPAIEIDDVAELVKTFERVARDATGRTF